MLGLSIEQEAAVNARAVDEEIRQIHELLSLRPLLGDRGVPFEDLDRHNAFAIPTSTSQRSRAARVAG